MKAHVFRDLTVFEGQIYVLSAQQGQEALKVMKLLTLTMRLAQQLNF